MSEPFETSTADTIALQTHWRTMGLSPDGIEVRTDGTLMPSRQETHAGNFAVASLFAVMLLVFRNWASETLGSTDFNRRVVLALRLIATLNLGMITALWLADTDPLQIVAWQMLLFAVFCTTFGAALAPAGPSKPQPSATSAPAPGPPGPGAPNASRATTPATRCAYGTKRRRARTSRQRIRRCIGRCCARAIFFAPGATRSKSVAIFRSSR